MIHVVYDQLYSYTSAIWPQKQPGIAWVSGLIQLSVASVPSDD